eukprot:GHVU01185773.1.p1 GENE.GHVU01185773.1~~GHVU01185773.1.p1  ORF type:complete len:320 (-),score=44.08 GHVU01185773.1:1174-2133(-)
MKYSINKLFYVYVVLVTVPCLLLMYRIVYRKPGSAFLPKAEANIRFLPMSNSSLNGVSIANLLIPDRKKYMEEFIQPLINLESVDAVSETEVVNLSTIGKNDFNALPLSKKMTVRRILSHLKAIKQLYRNGHDYGVVLEDSMSVILKPHWKYTILETAELAGVHYPDWNVLRLEYNYLKNREQPFVDMSSFFQDDHKNKFLKDDDPVRYGAGANLYRRSGMKQILDKYEQTDGKFKISTDLTLRKALELTSAYMVYPSMFTPRFGAGPMCSAEPCLDSEIAYDVHKQQTLDDVRATFVVAEYYFGGDPVALRTFDWVAT